MMWVLGEHKRATSVRNLSCTAHISFHVPSKSTSPRSECSVTQPDKLYLLFALTGFYGLCSSLSLQIWEFPSVLFQQSLTHWLSFAMGSWYRLFLEKGITGTDELHVWNFTYIFSPSKAAGRENLDQDLENWSIFSPAQFIFSVANAH